MSLAIRIDSLDALFSSYIKARDKVCQRCGGTKGLQNAHYHGRRKQSVRFDPDNCCLLCFGCHNYFHGNPYEFTEWTKRRLGEDKFDMLNARARQIGKIDKEANKLWLQSEIKKLEAL